MALKISLISPKGGVGKTTLAVNFASALADMGLKVLAIDLDSQQSLTKSFDYTNPISGGLTDFIINKNKDVIAQTHIDNLSMIINDDLNEDINKWMENHFSGNFALKTLLKSFDDDFDVIIMDTQGKDGRGQLQEMALITSDIVITPTLPDMMSSQELPRSLDIFNQVVNGMKEMGLQSTPPTLKLLINQIDNTKETRAVTAAIREQFGDIARHITVLKTMIPSRVVYKKSISNKTPAHRIERSRNTSDMEAINVMERLVHEILPHFADLKLGGNNE